MPLVWDGMGFSVALKELILKGTADLLLLNINNSDPFLPVLTARSSSLTEYDDRRWWDVRRQRRGQ